jgi:hypothetical protein
MKLSLEYVILGIAVLFMATLLYGTWRRQEQFTTIQGNYPPWILIQKQVSDIFDKYYEYDLSAFASIGEVDVFDAGKKAIGAPGLTDGIEANLKFVIEDPSKLETNPNGKEAAVFIRQFQKFLPAGFVPDLVNAPVTTHMGVLEAARKYTGSLVKGYDPKKPGPVPIIALISAYYMIEVVSVTFKNAIILEYIKVAFETVKPKLKTA